VAMRVAIMQPYLFPYLGYFQLIRAVDIFVIHDDVQYIKGGWINRNRIISCNKTAWIRLSVRKDSFRSPISERTYVPFFDAEKVKMLRQIESSYRRAPFYKEVYALIQRILECDDKTVSLFNINQLKVICSYLEIQTPIVISSEINKDNTLRGQERVINIIKRLGASEYINPEGGRALYDAKTFMQNNVILWFLQSGHISYPQFGGTFIPSFSIIDVMMFNSPDMLNALLGKYELVY